MSYFQAAYKPISTVKHIFGALQIIFLIKIIWVSMHTMEKIKR